MAKLEGFYLAGVLEGFVSTPWKNDPNKMNHRVGISRVFVDDWGNESRDTITVDVPMQSVEAIRKQCDMMKGKPVIVRVVPQARSGGRTGSWLSVFIPQGEHIVPQPAGSATTQAA